MHSARWHCACRATAEKQKLTVPICSHPVWHSVPRRVQVPEECPDILVKLMQTCWVCLPGLRNFALSLCVVIRHICPWLLLPDLPAKLCFPKLFLWKDLSCLRTVCLKPQAGTPAKRPPFSELEPERFLETHESHLSSQVCFFVLRILPMLEQVSNALVFPFFSVLSCLFLFETAWFRSMISVRLKYRARAEIGKSLPFFEPYALQTGDVYKLNLL